MPATLLPDNLVTVSKKAILLEAQGSWIDLQTFGRLNLMSVSRSAMNSTLFHLRDLTTLGSYSNAYDVTLTKSGSLKHGMGYWFTFWLLTKDVLRLDNCFVFSADRQIHVKEGELPIESLVQMAQIMDSPMNQKRVEQWDLTGSMLELNAMKAYVHEDFGCIEPVLNINAEKLELETVETPYLFSAVVVPKQSGLFIADRIKNLRIINNDVVFIAHMDAGKFLHDRLSVLLHYVLACCPNLEKLTVDIDFDSPDHFEPYVRWIQLFNEKQKNGTLMSLEMHDCELIIATRATFPGHTLSDAIQNQHAVTKMGEHSTTSRRTGTS